MKAELHADPPWATKRRVRPHSSTLQPQNPQKSRNGRRSTGSPLIDGAQASMTTSARLWMPCPCRRGEVSRTGQVAGRSRHAADANKSFADKANASQAITPTAAAKIRMRASGK